MTDPAASPDRTEGPAAGPDPILECRNIWKLYGPEPKRFLARSGGAPELERIKAEGYIPAVCAASFGVRRGENLVIMGLSGSGKSTLVRCLSRLIEPTAGEVSFEGRDLLGTSAQDMIELRRHRMGMVFQHFALLPHRTVLQNVAFPLEVQGIERAKREERAREMIELVGLQGREGYYPRELSGGQQQRVGIARSLAVGPDLWFLDEPFSALDPLIRREMQNEFLRLQSRLQKTIVFITHDFDEAIRLADRVAIMKDGRIEQIGPPADIIAAPATDYVAEFTKDIASEKLLRVADLLGPGEADGGVRVPVEARLSEVAAAILRAPGDATAVNGAGEPVGVVSRERVIDALFGKSAAS